jgi:hypothetical protein
VIDIVMLALLGAAAAAAAGYVHLCRYLTQPPE